MRKRRRGEPLDLLLATQGVGPLLRRDYWAVILRCRFTPVQVVQTVRRYFPSFAPSELVVFTPRGEGGRSRRLEIGDEFDVRILGLPRARVRVTQAGPRSFTLATEQGHPEAGRITFGAYRNRHGDVIFHIRSHARSSGLFTRAGFLATGEVMQTNSWSDFVNRVAVAFGDGVLGFIHAVTSPCADEEPDVTRNTPTYEARGG